MTTKTRVRGLLTTPSGGVLLIKRTRPGQDPYWVFPGGGVEEFDESFEAALVREVFEELGGNATVRRLVYILTRDSADGSVEKELYFLGSLDYWSREEATGDEFTRGAASGGYDYDEVPTSMSEWLGRNIKPDEVKAFIAANLDNLDGLPDLR